MFGVLIMGEGAARLRDTHEHRSGRLALIMLGHNINMHVTNVTFGQVIETSRGFRFFVT